MALNHGTIKDTDPHFIINTTTRQLSTESKKIMLVQGDHNSERITFEAPQEIEGHKMDQSGKIQIHYINIDQLTKETSKGLFEAQEVEIIPATVTNPAKITFSWLIDGTATKYQGALNFVVRFVCEEGSRTLYSWSTAIYSGISITDGINNSAAIVDDNIDLLRQWESELKANQIVSLTQTKVGASNNGVNEWTATFGNGRTSAFTVKDGEKGDKGDKGDTGLVGSIETVDKEPLHFFAGTKTEYEALEDKLNVFAIITDDTTADDFNKVMSGEEAVPKAEKATNVEGDAPISLASFFNDTLTFTGSYNKDLSATEQANTFPAGFYSVVCTFYLGSGTSKVRHIQSALCYISPYNKTFASGCLSYECDLGVKINNIPLKLIFSDGNVGLAIPSLSGTNPSFGELTIKRIS